MVHKCDKYCFISIVLGGSCVELFVNLDFPICQDLNYVNFGILHKKLCI